MSGSAGSYPLQVLPGFMQRLSPFLPITHAINAMRAAIAGIYQNDYWVELGKLLLFVPAAAVARLVAAQAVGRAEPPGSGNNWSVPSSSDELRPTRALLDDGGFLPRHVKGGVERVRRPSWHRPPCPPSTLRAACPPPRPGTASANAS